MSTFEEPGSLFQRAGYPHGAFQFGGGGLHQNNSDPPAVAVYGTMFAALSSLPALQRLGIKLGKPTASTAALPFLDAFNHLAAPRLTDLEVDVRVNAVKLPPPRS